MGAHADSAALARIDAGVTVRDDASESSPRTERPLLGTQPPHDSVTEEPSPRRPAPARANPATPIADDLAPRTRPATTADAVENPLRAHAARPGGTATDTAPSAVRPSATAARTSGVEPDAAPPDAVSAVLLGVHDRLAQRVAVERTRATRRPLVGQRELLDTSAAHPATPAGVVSAIEDAVGGDLGSVAVVRDDAAAREAAAIGAKAFTRDATVYLPPGLGPVTAEPARSVLAHELVHVTQQRRLGGSVPPEISPRGRRLEHEAASVAARVASLPTETYVHAPNAPAAPVPTPHAATPPRATPALAASPGAPAPHGVQRAPVDEPPAAKPPEKELDLDDLARRLYPRLRPYLRKELSLDRERAALVLGTRR
jgi:hypothetical protein